MRRRNPSPVPPTLIKAFITVHGDVAHMERRWGIRKSVDVEVVIDCQRRGLLRGRLGNVSVGGLFVRTEPSVLTRNTHVEVVLMLQHADGTRVYRMPALVVRLSPNGVGLMLDQY